MVASPGLPISTRYRPRPHVARTDLHEPCTPRVQWEGFLWELCYCLVTTVFISSAPCRTPQHFNILRCKQQRFCLSLGVYSSTRNWRKIKVMYDILWETEQNKKFLFFVGPESLLTLILRRSRTGTVWFYTSTSNKRAVRPKLYTKSLAGDLKRMYSRLTLVRISINL